MNKVVFILGPTGCGKSDMAINLAKSLNGEIISADSVQVYKNFNIGSAKITPEEMQGIKHHCIDICEPTQYFSVGDFVELTREKIMEISARGKLPFIVGGTGLYVTSLVHCYNFGDAERHEDFRRELELQAEREGLETLYNKLKKIAPLIATKISPTDKKRIIRGLEIAEFGESQTSQKPDFEYKIFALNLDRQVLYQRINNRVDKMLKMGLIDEVKSLLKYGKDIQPMKAIGYKEIVEGLETGDLNTAIELVKQHSRNYAKRQLTYLRGLEKSAEVEYIDVSDFNKAFTTIEGKIKEWL